LVGSSGWERTGERAAEEGWIVGLPTT